MRPRRAALPQRRRDAQLAARDTVCVVQAVKTTRTSPVEQNSTCDPPNVAQPRRRAPPRRGIAARAIAHGAAAASSSTGRRRRAAAPARVRSSAGGDRGRPGQRRVLFGAAARRHAAAAVLAHRRHRQLGDGDPVHRLPRVRRPLQPALRAGALADVRAARLRRERGLLLRELRRGERVRLPRRVPGGLVVQRLPRARHDPRRPGRRVRAARVSLRLLDRGDGALHVAAGRRHHGPRLVAPARRALQPDGARGARRGADRARRLLLVLRRGARRPHLWRAAGRGGRGGGRGGRGGGGRAVLDDDRRLELLRHRGARAHARHDGARARGRAVVDDRRQRHHLHVHALGGVRPAAVGDARRANPPRLHQRPADRRAQRRVLRADRRAAAARRRRRKERRRRLFPACSTAATTR